MTKSSAYALHSLKTSARNRKIVHSPASSRKIRSPVSCAKQNVASEQEKSGAQQKSRIGTGPYHFALYLEPCELRRDAQFWDVSKKKYSGLSRKEKQHWAEVARIKGNPLSHNQKIPPLQSPVKIGDQAKNEECPTKGRNFLNPGARNEPRMAHADEKLMESPVQPDRRSLGSFGSFFSTDLSQHSVAPSQTRKRPPFAHPTPTSTSADLVEPLRRAGALEKNDASSLTTFTGNARNENIASNNGNTSAVIGKPYRAPEKNETSSLKTFTGNERNENIASNNGNTSAVIGKPYRAPEKDDVSQGKTRTCEMRNENIASNNGNTYRALEKNETSSLKMRICNARNENFDSNNGNVSGKPYRAFEKNNASPRKTPTCNARNENFDSNNGNVSAEMEKPYMGAKIQKTTRNERSGMLMKEPHAADVSDVNVASRKQEYTPQNIRPPTMAAETLDDKGQNTASRGGAKRKVVGSAEFGGTKKAKRDAKAMLAREKHLRHLIAQTATKDAHAQHGDGAHVREPRYDDDDDDDDGDGAHMRTPMDKKQMSLPRTRIKAKRNVKAMQAREKVLRDLIGKTADAPSSIGHNARMKEPSVIGMETHGEQMLEGDDAGAKGGAASQTTACDTKKQPLTDEEMIAYAAKASSFLIYMNVAHDLRPPTVQDVKDWRNLSLVDQAVLAAIYNHRNFLEEVGFLQKAFGEFPWWYINNTLLWNPFAHFLRDHVGNVTSAQGILQAEKNLFNSPLELKRKYVCTNL